MKQEDVFQCLIRNQKELEIYNVKSLSLFGSVARGEEKQTSDIDILVSFEGPIGLFTFLKLKERLEEILGGDVDLVTEQALHPRLHDKIMEESVHVF